MRETLGFSVPEEEKGLVQLAKRVFFIDSEKRLIILFLPGRWDAIRALGPLAS
jgi:hypothetical protein